MEKFKYSQEMKKLSEEIFALVAPHDHEGPTTEEDIQLINIGLAARKLEASLEQMQAVLEAMERIVQWSEAYPLDVFPEPDFKKAHKLLKAGGMTLDAISASNMRHVVEGVGKIAKESLAALEQEDEQGN